MRLTIIIVTLMLFEIGLHWQVSRLSLGHKEEMDLPSNFVFHSKYSKKADFHPRVVCFLGINYPKDSCDSTMLMKTDSKQRTLDIHFSDLSWDLSRSRKVDVDEDETCKYQDPLYQPMSAAPSTCNDIHLFGFDIAAFETQLDPNRNSAAIKYITSGRTKSVWKITTLDEKLNEELFIMKAGKYNNVKEDFYEKSRRDALVAGRAGNSQLSAMIESLHSTSSVDSPHMSSNSTG